MNILEILAVTCTLLGILFYGNKDVISGAILSIMGNVLWIIWAVSISSSAVGIIVINTCILICNFYNLIKEFLDFSSRKDVV